MHYIRIWSSRTGNVLHSSRESAFACLLFNKVEEVQHSIVIPSDSHSGINYPPFAKANGFETTDCLEYLQILDILIYGRRVCFRIWSSRMGNVLHASVNQLLHFYLLQEENIPLHTVPNSVGICRQQTKFATFTLSLQNGKSFFRSFMQLWNSYFYTRH